MLSILFVCTANICRSPMAEVLFRGIAAQDPAGIEWRVESAGTWAMEDLPVARRSQQVMSERGHDLSRHRSRPVSRELLRQFDLILTMESGHKEALRVEFPDLAGRIYLLTEMADASYDIRDPIGGALEDFEDTAVELESLLTQGIPRIAQLAAAKGEQ